ncbi:uncharacterized protein LAJ45_09008 [Morchella importuna]|uniref:uncharacterized protein n=1 Tax=Morchella importuna TaxID=1174673 RepID=UPI001E8EDC7C|nr:uncharacterized protein LAJ45_09008 [Morchella importuna]KAH8146928.1 hypothetical protein LAJ45_09008 [Morchella importuna]
MALQCKNPPAINSGLHRTLNIEEASCLHNKVRTSCFSANYRYLQYPLDRLQIPISQSPQPASTLPTPIALHSIYPCLDHCSKLSHRLHAAQTPRFEHSTDSESYQQLGLPDDGLARRVSEPTSF